MEDWVERALRRWPDVPALYGWLGLSRRGQWTIRGETISRPQIIDTINANYGVDARGAWYFQNGPQRGYVRLEAAPMILSAAGDGTHLCTHTGATVRALAQALLDETGALWLLSEHGPGLLVDADLGWASDRLVVDGAAADEDALVEALALPDQAETGLRLDYAGQVFPLRRLDAALAPARLGFVREPQPPA